MNLSETKGYDYDIAGSTAKMSSTQTELKSLGKATDELIMNLDDLEQRLSPVLNRSEKDKQLDTPVPSLAPLPTEIRNQRDTVERANLLLRSILSRLEL